MNPPARVVSRTTRWLSVLLLLSTPVYGDTTRVSVDSSGLEANSTSYNPALSADGRIVAFWSDATNLVAGDTNGVPDVFVHDRQTGVTTRVSVGAGGRQGNGVSAYPALSADGRFVTFASGACDLVSGDANDANDVFVHDRQTGTTDRASVNSAGTEGNASSIFSALSVDGRFVAFRSNASNLVKGDTNAVEDVFVHDRQTGTTTRVNVDSAGLQTSGGINGIPALSDDGRFVSFGSAAADLVAGDTNGLPDVFVHDRQTGSTTRVSVDSAGNEANADSYALALSADGRSVAFESFGTNLVPADTNGAMDIFVHEIPTGTTVRVSVDSAGTQGDHDSFLAALNADGRFVAFGSGATNLVPGDTNGERDVFVHDLQTGTTTRASVNSAGNQSSGIGAFAFPPAINADATFVAFDSEAADLVEGDTNDVRDVFVHEQVVACHGPIISDVLATPDALWPVRHKMVPVAIGYTVGDECDPAPLCSLSVSSSDGGSGDWEVRDAHNVSLRAKSAGKGMGRIYTITISCQDDQNLSAHATVEVTVPRDRKN